MSAAAKEYPQLMCSAIADAPHDFVSALELSGRCDVSDFHPFECAGFADTFAPLDLYLDAGAEIGRDYSVRSARSSAVSSFLPLRPR